MAWTPPRTWSDTPPANLVTAAMLNVDLRDNLQYVKDVLDGVQGQDVTLARGSADGAGRALTGIKARGTLAAPAAVVQNDLVFDLAAAGYNAGAYRSLSLIRAYVWGVGATYLEGALDFYTYRSTDGAPVRALRLVGGVAAFADGTAGAPAIAFDADPNNGLYRINADDWALAVGGVKALELMLQGASPVLVAAGALNVLGSDPNANQMLVKGAAGQISRLLAVIANNNDNVFEVAANYNIGLMAGSGSANYGGGTRVVFVGNAAGAPSSNPAGGGILYAQAGALVWRGSSGTVTTIAAA